MNQRLLGFFSGFPNRRFPACVAKRLQEELTCRDSLVFVSAWPMDYAQNDDDSAGMHGMFKEWNMPFAQHCVIDARMDAAQAAQRIREASCIFLMGGHPGQQRQLLREKQLDDAIRGSSAVVLGVSAGAINMAKRSVDTKESLVPYEGLGLADITIKPHFCEEDQRVLAQLLQVSMELPICATQDESAIFVAGGRISCLGKIHWVNKGEIGPISQSGLLLP